jgi:phosphotriesterase-related protein
MGVKPNRIAISHIDVENRLDYILTLLKMGVYVEFDNFGKEYYVNREVRNSGYGLFVRDIDRVKLLKYLIDNGYRSQILLSCDVCLKTCLRTYGGWGYDHLLTNVIPMMEDEGITKEDIDAMLITNPANFLDNDKGE